MNPMLRACALFTAVVLAACGGGGGGGGAGAGGLGGGSPQSLTIAESNAKPVSANALEAAQTTSATSGATGPLGVQVDADANAGASSLQAIAEVARLAAAKSLGGSSLAVGVVLSPTTESCDLGGTLTVSGNIASSAGLSAGDSLSISTSNCAMNVGATTAVMNGSMTLNVVSGSLPLFTSGSFHVVLAVTATNLSLASGGVTVVSTGDTRLDWAASSATSQTLVASGSSMSSRTTISGATHTTTIRNFSQSVTISGGTYTGTLAATVETDSARIGAGTVTYTISTPTPVQWNASTRAATAGVVKVVGANNASLLITIAGGGGVTIQIDANGDGTYEKTVNSTVAELAGLV